MTFFWSKENKTFQLEEQMKEKLIKDSYRQLSCKHTSRQILNQYLTLHYAYVSGIGHADDNLTVSVPRLREF